MLQMVPSCRVTRSPYLGCHIPHHGQHLNCHVVHQLKAGFTQFLYLRLCHHVKSTIWGEQTDAHAWGRTKQKLSGKKWTCKGIEGGCGSRLVPRDVNVQIGRLQNDPRVQNKEYKRQATLCRLGAQARPPSQPPS